MSQSVKRIGFVDNQLDNYHANTYLAAIRGPLRDRGYEVTGCNALHADTGRAWAAQHDVPYFDSLESLNDAVDFYMILAPSDPQLHGSLCQQVFPFGKPTYLDKTFAPDLPTAQAIYALADQHQVVMQTTSALRYTNVQTAAKTMGLENLRHMIAWGSGRSFEEYAIHPVELLISCMGPGATRLFRRGQGDASQLVIDFTDGRTGVVNVYVNSETPFAASLTTSQKTQYLEVDGSQLFVDAMAGILDLFDQGQANIDRRESLMIRQILDVAQQPEALNGYVSLSMAGAD